MTDDVRMPVGAGHTEAVGTHPDLARMVARDVMLYQATLKEHGHIDHELLHDLVRDYQEARLRQLYPYPE